jgi:hypothetical protein
VLRELIQHPRLCCPGSTLFYFETHIGVFSVFHDSSHLTWCKRFVPGYLGRMEAISEQVYADGGSQYAKRVHRLVAVKSDPGHQFHSPQINTPRHTNTCHGESEKRPA